MREITQRTRHSERTVVGPSCSCSEICGLTLQQIDSVRSRLTVLFSVLECSNECPSVRYETRHRPLDRIVTAATGIHPVTLDPACLIPDIWYSRSHIYKPVYHQHGRRPAWGFIFEDCRKTLYTVPSALVLFGRQLKTLREARNFSQERLGELCHFNRHYIGRIERGERVISFEYMMRIAFVLRVKPFELYKQIPVPDHMPKKGEFKGQKPSGTKKVQV